MRPQRPLKVILVLMLGVVGVSIASGNPAGAVPTKKPAVIHAVKSGEHRAPYQYATGFGIPGSRVYHIDRKVSLADVDHAIVNMHGSATNGSGEPIVWGYDRSGTSGYREYTGETLAQLLKSRGFKGSNVTLAICFSGSKFGKATYAQTLADALGVDVVGYDHLVGTPDVFSHPVTRAVVRSVGGVEIPLGKLPGSPVVYKPSTPTKPSPSPGSGTPQPPSGQDPSGGNGPSGSTPDSDGGNSSERDGYAPLPPVHITRPPGWGVGG